MPGLLQEIQIVSVLIAAGDGVDAGADHIGARMNDASLIAVVGKAARQPICNAKTVLRHRQQHDAAIGCEAAAVESSCDFLAGNGWKRKRQEIIVGHGGRGHAKRAKSGVSNQILRRIMALRHARQPQIEAVMNKSG